MRKFFILYLLISLGFKGYSQTYTDFTWSYNLALGAANMMGDLGGSDFIGNEGMDLDFKSFRPAIGAGIMFNRGSFSLGTNLWYTRLAGNDEFTIQEFQNKRNLCVSTDLLELNLITEIRPFGRSYTLNRFYVYGGIAGIYYQPKAEYDDERIKLRPLGTEGQNYLENSNPYSELDLVIPYGFGYKFKLERSTSLVLDFGFRKTFTDYLDDVSTVYADPVALAASDGDLAVALADRSIDGMVAGSERGNPEKDDFYFIISLKFEKILGGHSSSGCYYNKNPRKKRRVRQYQKKMFNKW
jgi:hypothetical protein